MQFKYKKILLMFTALISLSLPMTSFAQENSSELTDEMVPVGGHTLPPNLFGGSSNSQDKKDVSNNDVASSSVSKTGGVTPPVINDDLNVPKKETKTSPPKKVKVKPKKVVSDSDFRPVDNDSQPEPTKPTPKPANNNQNNGFNNNQNMFNNQGNSGNQGNQNSQGNGNNNQQQALPEGLVEINRDNIDRNAEFDEALRNLIPPTEFTKKVKEKKDESDRANALPVGKILKPITRTLNMTLRPGEMPPTIHLAQGAVTTLTFSDITGAPWYIGQSVTDADAYQTTKGSDSSDVKSNILTIYPKTKYSYGRNISIMLEHAAVPVILQLDTALDTATVDYRVDIKIMQRGPNAKANFVDMGTTVSQDDDMQAFVDGLPPKGSKSLKTSSDAVEAWKFKGMMYVRTSLRLMNPIWIRKSSSNLSGDTVYVLRPVPDIILSSNGNLVSVMVKQ